MKTDKAVDAMRHLLMLYSVELQNIPGIMSAYVNASDHIDFAKLVKMIDKKAEEYAALEQKSNIVKNFLTQMLTQTTPKSEPPPSTEAN